MISNFLSETRRRNALLYWSAVGNLVLFFVMLLLSVVDDRTVMGINTWIKPMKFAASFVIFMLTFAWMLHYLPRKRDIKILSWGFFICMVFEMLTIGSQAARGVRSHYNADTPYDILVFGIMGLFILINTLLSIYAIILFLKPNHIPTPAVKVAWRIGLVLFVLGSISGGMMVGQSAHTFGASDGGPGLPFLNWSTNAGDMRVAHFFTLHSLQVLPIGIWWLSKKTVTVVWQLVFISTYTIFCVYLHLQAMNGGPFIG
jgi:hypothetical protein